MTVQWRHIAFVPCDAKHEAQLPAAPVLLEDVGTTRWEHNGLAIPEGNRFRHNAEVLKRVLQVQVPAAPVQIHGAPMSGVCGSRAVLGRAHWQEGALLHGSQLRVELDQLHTWAKRIRVHRQLRTAVQWG